MKTTVDTGALRTLLPLPPAAPSTVHPLAAVATPTAPDRLPERDLAGERRFAALLRERRDDAAAAATGTVAAPAATGNDVASPPAAADGCAAPDDAATSSPPATAATKTTKARAPLATRPSDKAAVDRTTASERTQRDADSRDDDGSVAATAIATTATATISTGERAATLALVAVQSATHDGATAHRDAVDATVDDAARTGDRIAETRTVRAPGYAARDGDDIGALAHDRAVERAPAEPTFVGALSETLRATEPSGPHGAARVDAPLAALAAGTSVMSGADATADVATKTIALPTPTDAPEFAAALGVQVSVLARDGVQHAELHLHPVETGPVSIRIEVDGTNARVDFGADLASTRDAIERGLPELASALRDAGLTLAGGGVSQHAGSRRHGDDGGPERARADAGAAAIAPATAPAPRAVGRRVAAGGVDLYA